MKTVKKYWIGLIVLSMILSLAACQKEDEKTDNSQNAMQVVENNQESLPDGTLDAEASEVQESSALESSTTESSTVESSMIESSETESSAPDTTGQNESEPESEAEESRQPISVDSNLGTSQITWGPGVQFDDLNRPTACVSLQNQYGYLNASFIGEASNTIYLTFDEGYENGYTGAILDTLQEKQVQAVFFVTMSYVKSEPELVQRMIQEGHVVGNHSTNHPNMTTISVEEGRQEVQELHDYMMNQYGYQMTLFRAPEGAFSERSLALLQEMGYQSIFWSFAYHDWDPAQQMDPADALQRTTERLHPGAIYLLHAVSKTNTEILGSFIDAVRAQGYSFGSLEG